MIDGAAIKSLHFVHVDQLLNQLINFVLGGCLGANLKVLDSQFSCFSLCMLVLHFAVVLQVCFVADQDDGFILVDFFSLDFLDFLDGDLIGLLAIEGKCEDEAVFVISPHCLHGGHVLLS